jgi:hypothetical protein
MPFSQNISRVGISLKPTDLGEVRRECVGWIHQIPAGYGLMAGFFEHADNIKIKYCCV